MVTAIGAACEKIDHVLDDVLAGISSKTWALLDMPLHANV